MPCYRPLIRFVLNRGRGNVSPQYHDKTSNASSSGLRDEVVYNMNNPPQIPATVIDSRTDPEMSESVPDPSHHHRRFMRHSDEESLVDLAREYRS